MDGNALMFSFLFGMVGTGMLMYGRKASRLVPVIVGLGLMILPCVIPNLLVMTIVCGAMALTPFFVRA